jgi:thioredoxin reductase (NADPH)
MELIGICYGSDRIGARAIILAVHTSLPRLDISGEVEFFGNRRVSTRVTHDGAFYQNEIVTVIGDGDSACGSAYFLTNFCSKVYVIHCRSQLWTYKIIANRVLAHAKAEILWNTTPFKICREKKMTDIRLRT